jgi:replicative DNA helicase
MAEAKLLPFERSRPMVLTDQADAALNGTLTWADDDIAAMARDLDGDGAGARLCYTTGLADLDALTCGYTQGNVYLVAGRTGAGKSSFALTSTLTLATAGAPPVLYASLEMPARDMALRAAAWLTGLSQRRLLDADVGRVRLEPTERALVAQAAAWIPKRVRMLAGDFSVSEIRAQAARLQAEAGLSIVVCDHVGLVRGEKSSRGETREREVAAASRGMKKLAMELNVPVLMLAQLNRGADDADEPELRFLRESGGLEQDAAVCAFLWPTADRARDRARVFVLKNRFGEHPRALEVPWDGASGRIGEIATEAADAG